MSVTCRNRAVNTQEIEARVAGALFAVVAVGGGFARLAEFRVTLTDVQCLRTTGIYAAIDAVVVRIVKALDRRDFCVVDLATGCQRLKAMPCTAIGLDLFGVKVLTRCQESTIIITYSDDWLARGWHILDLVFPLASNRIDDDLAITRRRVAHLRRQRIVARQDRLLVGRFFAFFPL